MGPRILIYTLLLFQIGKIIRATEIGTTPFWNWKRKKYSSEPWFSLVCTKNNIKQAIDSET